LPTSGFARTIRLDAAECNCHSGLLSRSHLRRGFRRDSTGSDWPRV